MKKLLLILAILSTEARATTIFDKIITDYVNFTRRSSAPSAPPSGQVASYVLDSDGKLYIKNSSGTAKACTFSGDIINADVNASAAIARSKIASGTNYAWCVNSSSGVLSDVSVTASRAVVTDSNGSPAASAVTATELGYVAGVSSAIQTQLNAKEVPLSFTAPLSRSTNTISCVVATGSVAGCLAAADFTTFNAKESALTFSTGLTRSTNTITVNSSQSIATLSNLTSNGYVKTGGGIGTLSVSSPTTAFAELYQTISTSSGDMIYGGASGTPTRLQKGSDGQVMTLASGVPTWAAASGGGAGSFNIAVLDTAGNNWAISSQTSSDAETTVGNWLAYADAAATTPVDMTAGSPNTTCTRNTSSPINGTGDFKMTVTTGATRQGEGCSLLINIPTAYRGKAIRVIAPYATTGTISQGDFVPYAYDVTNSSILAPSATVSGISGAAGNLYSIFMTQTSTAQLRIGLHIARSSNTGAVTINWDDFKVEPDLNQANVPVSDWIAYTPTFTGLGTVSTSAFFWRRTGDSVEIEGTFTSGTNSGELRVSLPNGVISDSTKVPAIRPAGDYIRNSSTSAHGGKILIESGVGYFTFGGAETYGSGTITAGSKLSSGLSSEAILISGVKIPISGWSSGGGTSPILSLSDTRTDPGFTPSAGFGTVTNKSIQWSRVGDRMRVRGYFTMGTVAGSTASIALPTGYKIDAAKLSSVANVGYLGMWQVLYQGGTNNSSSTGYRGVVQYDGSDTSNVYITRTTSAGVNVKENASGFLNTGDGLSFEFDFPVSGWTSVSSGTLTAPRSEVFVTTGNGYGATNTKIRRYTTTQTNVGPAITYADSSTLGATFTINEAGVYSMGVTDVRSGAQANMGISKNSASLTTDIDSISASERIAFTQSGGATLAASLSRTINLNAGDVIRVHDTGSCTGSTAYNSYFYIVKVSN